jgi:proline dehydrogenase
VLTYLPRFTGAGSQALYNLTHSLPPSPALDAAITEICTLAHSRSVRLVFDAEQASLQPGIDAWTLSYMSRYNTPSRATVYCTYQCYLKAAPRVLSTHLAAARREGFALGVKLVRGAYINSDPRHLIHDTKADTDVHYDALAEAVLRRSYNDVLRPAEGEAGQGFPAVNLALACHNIDSVRKAQAIRKEQTSKGEDKIELVYAQLQGMADEVSCELVQEANFAKEVLEKEGMGEGVLGVEVMKTRPDVPQAYKYLVWGTTGQCMKYLLRRAQENKDAVKRTREGRDLMVGEMGRRVKGLFGLKA